MKLKSPPVVQNERGDKEMGTMRRMSVTIPDEIDAAVLSLRKTDEFCRCSYSEILRHLLSVGVEQEIQDRALKDRAKDTRDSA